MPAASETEPDQSPERRIPPSRERSRLEFQAPSFGQTQLRPLQAFGWQGCNYLSHHLLLPRVCTIRELESAAQLVPEFKNMTQDVGILSTDWTTAQNAQAF